MIRTKPIRYYVDDNGCWICVSHSYSKAGYPVVAVKRQPMTLVRAIAKEKYPDLPSYIHVLHKCNNPSCVNPTHLYLGTHEDNMHDRKESGHYADATGENNNNSKLSDSTVLAIRELYVSTVTTHRKIAQLFGISKTQVTRILNNKQWRKN